MEKKFIIIVLASAVALSSMIFFAISYPDLLLMIIDKKIFPSKTDNLNDFVSVHFSPEAKRILDDCKENHSCLFDSLNELAQTDDQQTVLRTFFDITSAIKQTESECHILGHPLGKFLYRNTGNLVQSISLIDRTCGGSIYHGIMAEYFKIERDSESDTSSYIVAIKVCNELFDVSYSQIRSECAHGVGHGLVIAHNYDALTAVKRCEEFEDGFAQRSCVEGAFMENALEYNRTQGGTFDEHDVLYPCSVLEKFEGACYHYHSIYLLKKMNYSVEFAFEQCEKNKNLMHVKHCYYGIGIMEAFYSLDNLENIVFKCQKGNPTYQTYCFEGAVYDVADQWGIKQGFEFCKLLSSSFQKDCYRTLGKLIHTIYFTEEEIVKSCSVLRNAEHYQVCVNANPNEIGLL